MPLKTNRVQILGEKQTSLMPVISTPSTTTAASIVASKLPGAVIPVSASLMILAACLVVSIVTSKSSSVLRALLTMHLMVEMSRVTPERLLILVGECRRKAGLTWLSWHINSRTGTTGLGKRRIRTGSAFDFGVRLQSILVDTLLTAMLLKQRLALARVSGL